MPSVSLSLTVATPSVALHSSSHFSVALLAAKPAAAATAAIFVRCITAGGGGADNDLWLGFRNHPGRQVIPGGGLVIGQ